MEEFTTRRNKLIERLAINSVAIIPSAKIQFRNNNIEYSFRQNSNFYYLTGYHEQDAIFVLVKGLDVADNKFILFGLVYGSAKMRLSQRIKLTKLTL